VTLLSHFTKFSAERGSIVPLVLAGPVNMPIPQHPQIISLGFVDDALRDALLERAAALLMPSPYESLSIVLLEAWNHARAVLVNARCSVIKGQTRRANGGLYYQDYDEFACALDRLLRDPELARRLGAQGLAYVEQEYRWPTVIAKVERLLASVGPTPSV
jgi:glycosyltransferase involved in cell wall biosynthesis